MPSGKIHDAVTVILALPTAAASFQATGRIGSTLLITGAFLFGGLMFGPDLDTHSKQYTRWSVFRWLWYPYRSFFQHRSRFSHGLVFGALIRVVYFLGALTLAAFLLLYAYAGYATGRFPDLIALAGTWHPIGEWVSRTFGVYALPLAFLGIWLGAASHTITDLAGTFIKTGRVPRFL
jgi:uncharacterized metal-binding protein